MIRMLVSTKCPKMTQKQMMNVRINVSIVMSLYCDTI